MNKYIKNPCGEVEEFLNQEQKLNQLAIQSKFMQRTAKKLDPRTFLQSMLKSVCKSDINFRSLAFNAGIIGKNQQSRQNYHKRCEQKAVDFLLLVLNDGVASKFAKTLEGIKSQNSPKPTRILIHDSTTQLLHKSLEAHFPGASNQTGNQAMLRIQYGFDLLSGQTLFAETRDYRQNDAAASTDILQNLGKNDLLLRDLGYFNTEIFQKIDASGNFYLSRYKKNMLIYKTSDAGKKQKIPLKFAQTLRNHRGDYFEKEVLLGSKNQIPTRLVAWRMPPEKADQKKRELRQEMRKKGQTPSQDQLGLCSWVILISNCPNKMFSAKQLLALYRTRWQIELAFKGMKSFAYKAISRHKTNRHHVRCLILAQKILTIISLKLWRSIQNNHQKIAKALEIILPKRTAFSLLKIFYTMPDIIRQIILKPPQNCKNSTYSQVNKQILYHCRYDSRKRNNLDNQILIALS